MTVFDTLYKNLENNVSFPSDYLYKFIVPTTENQETEIKMVFSKKNATIKTKKSKTGKFVSVSVLLKAENANEVIEYYQSVKNIEGIISL